MKLKELAILKDSYDRRKELLEFQEQLRKHPLEVSEYRSLIEQANLEPKDKLAYLDHIRELKEKKMLIDDIPESFEEFRSRHESQGIVPIKKSVMKQMNSEEFAQLTKKRIALYDDMNGQEKIVHYEFNGQKSGEGISVVHEKTNDKELALNAQRRYGKAKDTISKTLAEIEVNSGKYKDFKN